MKPEIRIKQGGLMRCCIASALEEEAERGREDQPFLKNGDTYHCHYCGERMRMREGVVEWFPVGKDERGE